MVENDNNEKNDCIRSNFIREFVQRPNKPSISTDMLSRKIPKRIVQFWDNLDRLPTDVIECSETWRETEEWGIERLLFNKQKAGDFISQKLGLRYKQAFDKCYHPAMQSDYFRLCYILVEGGCYIDMDDIYTGSYMQHLFDDGRLKIQPLCYDTETHTMVPPQTFTKTGANAEGWIFYFNNNPLIACRAHPIIDYALSQATLSLEKSVMNGLPEIQSTTGPGNLTKSIFDTVTANHEIEQTLLVLCDWEDIAKSKWELSYRNDERNWRLSNSQLYKEL